MLLYAYRYVFFDLTMWLTLQMPFSGFLCHDPMKRNPPMKLLRPLLLACSLLFAATAHAEKVTVAAAADLKFAMD